MRGPDCGADGKTCDGQRVIRPAAERLVIRGLAKPDFDQFLAPQRQHQPALPGFQRDATGQSGTHRQILEDRGFGGCQPGVGAHAAALRAANSGTLTATSAAAIGGQTLLPHFET